MFLLGFRRKLTALALCKSIESAIQWFQMHHRIIFATIQNPAVYLSGARVSIFSTLVPRLLWLTVYITYVLVKLYEDGTLLFNCMLFCYLQKTEVLTIQDVYQRRVSLQQLHVHATGACDRNSWQRYLGELSHVKNNSTTRNEQYPDSESARGYYGSRYRQTVYLRKRYISKWNPKDL